MDRIGKLGITRECTRRVIGRRMLGSSRRRKTCTGRRVAAYNFFLHAREGTRRVGLQHESTRRVFFPNFYYVFHCFAREG